MALIRWEPARELHTMQNEMNRLFGTFFDSPTPGNGAGNARAAGFRRWTSSRTTTSTSCGPTCRA